MPQSPPIPVAASIATNRSPSFMMSFSVRSGKHWPGPSAQGRPAISLYELSPRKVEKVGEIDPDPEIVGGKQSIRAMYGSTDMAGYDGDPARRRRPPFPARAGLTPCGAPLERG